MSDECDPVEVGERNIHVLTTAYLENGNNTVTISEIIKMNHYNNNHNINNSCELLLSAYYIPGSLLATLNALPKQSQQPQGGYSSYPHFTD